MRYFFSTGEPSGELSAALVAQEIAACDRRAQFAGIGDRRMHELGFDLWACSRGWSSILPFSVLARVPHMFAVFSQTLRRLLRQPPEVIVLVDFGAFNLRLASALRRRGYAAPIVYFFPPGAWFDKADQARAVARWTAPLPAFDHQYQFYTALGLPAHYFGHPLASVYALREARSAPPRTAGTVALLPGSRAAELVHHVPLLLSAVSRLREIRPALEAYFVAADDEAKSRIAGALRAHGAHLRIVRGTRDALATADGAWIASGTAVLEAALLGVPAIAFYRMRGFQMRIARYLYRGRHIALSNLIAGRFIVPEFVQDDAQPAALAGAMDALLLDPLAQYRALQELHDTVGSSQTLQQIADFVVEVAAG